MRNTEYLFFHFITVRPSGTAEVIGSPRHIGDERTHQATSTRFGSADGIAAVTDDLAQDMSHSIVVEVDDLTFQTVADFLFQRGQQVPRLVFLVSPGRQSDFDEARTGIHGQGRIRLALDQVHEFFFDKGFAHVIDFDVPRSDAALTAKGLKQPRFQAFFIHPAHFRRRSRQMYQGLAAFLHGHARCRPGTIVEEDRPLRDHSLALLVFRHGGTAMMDEDPLANGFSNGFIINEGQLHEAGSDDFRHIPLSRPETPGRNDQVDAGQSHFQGFFHALRVIANSCMVNDRIADFIEFPRQVS